MYVAVKGGEKAIANAHKLLAKQRRGGRNTAELGLKQIMGQLKLAVDRVMAEGCLYAPELAALAYSTQRGFGAIHPFVSELRKGLVTVEFVPEELGFTVVLAEIEITECEIVGQFNGTAGDEALFTRGYGLVFGDNEKKALSMAIVDRALRAAEFNEPEKGPAQNEEFVMLHSDNVEAAGFVQHIKLPHYVDFQAELTLLRSIRKRRVKK